MLTWVKVCLYLSSKHLHVSQDVPKKLIRMGISHSTDNLQKCPQFCSEGGAGQMQLALLNPTSVQWLGSFRSMNQQRYFHPLSLSQQTSVQKETWILLKILVKNASGLFRAYLWNGGKHPVPTVIKRWGSSDACKNFPHSTEVYFNGGIWAKCAFRWWQIAASLRPRSKLRTELRYKSGISKESAQRGLTIAVPHLTFSLRSLQWDRNQWDLRRNRHEAAEVRIRFIGDSKWGTRSGL